MATQMQLEVYFNGKSHSHPGIVKQRQLKSLGCRNPQPKRPGDTVEEYSCPSV